MTNARPVSEVEAERDRLGRQYDSLIALAQAAEAEGRTITPGEIFQLVITDPADAPAEERKSDE